jgi:hypothetical protein
LGQEGAERLVIPPGDLLQMVQKALADIYRRTFASEAIVETRRIRLTIRNAAQTTIQKSGLHRKEMVAQRSIGRKKLIKPDLSVYRGYPLVSTVYP